MLKVFLSSTSKDLTPERRAVEAAIQRMAAQYIGMEYFGSFAEEPLERCLDKVRSANVIILILGYKYGFVPDGSSISITEAEYRESIAKNVPVLPYLIKKYSFSTKSDDDPRLTKLKEELKLNHGVSWFTSPEDLAWKVVSDLAREFSSSLSPEKPYADNIRNQILIDPIRDRLNELIAILEDRAQRIHRELKPYYKYVPVKKYLSQFQDLHKRHIDSLREGKIIQAHELLSEIHKLSASLERDEFWTRHRAETPGMHYDLGGDAFQRGRLICEYIAGEMKVNYFGAGFRLYKTDAPTISVNLYEKILSREGKLEETIDKD